MMPDYELVDAGTLETAACVVLVIYIAAVVVVVKFLISTQKDYED